MKDIAIYGFGGFGREVATVLMKINELSPTWNLVGFFDDGVPIVTSNKYGRVLGNIEALNTYSTELHLVIAIGNPSNIRKIVECITNPLILFPNIFAPNLIIFDIETLKIGKGNLIFWGCRLSCDVVMGDFNLLNGAVSLGHDVKVGNYNVMSPSTRLSGDCEVGNENFFGVHSVVLQGVKIGSKTRIGVMSVVMRNTKDDNLYFGNPAKKIKNI